jgi:hypothetical protein
MAPETRLAGKGAGYEQSRLSSHSPALTGERNSPAACMGLEGERRIGVGQRAKSHEGTLDKT